MQANKQSADEYPATKTLGYSLLFVSVSSDRRLAGPESRPPLVQVKWEYSPRGAAETHRSAVAAAMQREALAKTAIMTHGTNGANAH